MRASDPITRRKRAKKERGAALIMVLLTLVVMTVFLTEVQQETSTSFSSALTARDQLRAEYHAKSAVNLARLLLAIEPRVRQQIAPLMAMLNAAGVKIAGGKAPQIPVWEFADQVLGAYNDTEGAEGFSALAGVGTEGGENLGLGGTGRFELVIVDEDSKINVNTAAHSDPLSKLAVASQLTALMNGPQYEQLFEKLDPDGQHSDRQTICGALIDWADYDQDGEACDPTNTNNVRAGVEDNFYQTIGLDYFRKNAAFDSLEELRMVRGITDDFWATFVDPDPSDPHKRVLTVWGQGKINVNSANAQTIYGLICADAPDHPMCPTASGFDPTQALNFMNLVQLVRMFTGGAPLFGSAGDFIATMQGGGMLGPFLMSAPPMGAGWTAYPQFKGEIKKHISTESKMFSIYANGIVPDKQGTHETRVSIHAVVDFRFADVASVVSGAQQALTGGQGTTPQNPNQAGQGGASATGNLPPDAQLALQQLSTNPLGNVVYYRVQ